MSRQARARMLSDRRQIDNRSRCASGTIDNPRAFTLIEVLVVTATIALLVSILLPSLSHARRQAAAVACGSNIRLLAGANLMYAGDHAGRLAPGAAGIRGKNLHRWHGTRHKIQSEFDPADGPLTPYLGVDRQIRQCPAFRPQQRGFEAGNGGYGYNNAYLGVQTIIDRSGATIITSDLAGTWIERIARPGQTIMFTDAAFAAETLIEYSFAEPRFHPEWGTRADPSIHFRHNAAANVAWADAHVSSERRTFTWSSGLYTADPDRLDIGWFGHADDNSLFDLQ